MASAGPPGRVRAVVGGTIARARLIAMSRYGAQFGPDITFLGVDRCDRFEEGPVGHQCVGGLFVGTLGVPGVPNPLHVDFGVGSFAEAATKEV